MGVVSHKSLKIYPKKSSIEKSRSSIVLAWFCWDAWECWRRKDAEANDYNTELTLHLKIFVPLLINCLIKFKKVLLNVYDCYN